MQAATLVKPTIEAYMDRANSWPKLSDRQVSALSFAIQEGHAAAEKLEAGEWSSGEQKRTLERAVADGRKAHSKFVNHNLRLVVKEANRHYQKVRGLMQLEDLIQEGNFGLMRACEKFDWTKGWKFSTYAVTWIRQTMLRSIPRNYRVTIPEKPYAKLVQAQRAEDRIASKIGRPPLVSEIAAETKLPEETIREIQVWRRATQVGSLDQPRFAFAAKPGTSTLSDSITDDDVKGDPEHWVESADRGHCVRAALNGLEERERVILTMRNGISDTKDEGEEGGVIYKNIAEHLAITVAEVKRIEKRAHSKLRHPAIGLEELLD